MRPMRETLRAYCLRTGKLHLLTEWLSVQNEQTPDDLTAFSRKKVWWLCERGHAWKTEILVRAVGGHGCPACAGTLDQLHAMGIQKVMFCGGGGVLDPNIGVGQLLLVEGAIRDEGFSYHYIEPSRIIYTEEPVTQRIADYLKEHSVPYLRGLTWTTDAIFRETQTRIENRRAEGAKIVEMEQAGCIAVAQFRGFSYGALIYGGDDVSQKEWDNRGWRSRQSIRYDLIELCKQLTKVL